MLNLTILPLVGLGVLDVDHALWLSLHYYLGAHVVLLLEAVVDPFVIGTLLELTTITRDGVRDLHDALPWPHGLAVLALHPVGWLCDLLHLEDLHTCSICFHGKVVFSVIHRIKDGVSNKVTFPFVVKLDKLYWVLGCWKFLLINSVNTCLSHCLVGLGRENDWSCFLLSGQLWKEVKFCDPVDSTFPSNHLGHVIVH